METFKQFAESLLNHEAEGSIDEALITFAGRAYPKFGQVVILAGGAGSGKGFVNSNLLGIEGKVFDVDALKKLAMGSKKFAQKVKDETGHDINAFDLKKSENVSKIHEILSDVYGITKKHQATMFASVMMAPAERKPNLIFDVTLKDVNKLRKITNNVTELGYPKENVHIVWVVNDIDVAIEQNRNRDRVVPEEILLTTHEGAALTMKKILDMDSQLSRYMDGDIWLAFNKVGVDTDLVKSNNGGEGTVLPKRGTDSDGKPKKQRSGKGSYIKDANYVQVKKQGKRQLSSKEIADDLYFKIKKYVPKTDTWD